MKGYVNIKGEDILVQEIVLECTIEDLKNLVRFASLVQERHEELVNNEEQVHTHYQDWYKEWTCGELDIVIATPPVKAVNKE